MVRLKNVDSLIINKTTSANVVVLIPPAAPPGDPPINIVPIKNSNEKGFTNSKSIVAKPAVLIVTVWKKEVNTFSPNVKFPIELGLFHSTAKKTRVPTTINPKVILIAKRV